MFIPAYRSYQIIQIHIALANSYIPPTPYLPFPEVHPALSFANSAQFLFPINKNARNQSSINKCSDPASIPIPIPPFEHTFATTSLPLVISPCKLHKNDCPVLHFRNLRYKWNSLTLILQHSKSMESLDRKDNNRLLSSLIDLKLENVKNETLNEQGKRKTRKIGALRAIYDNEIYENFIEIIQKKTINDKALILKSLKTHFTFSSLIEDKEIKELLLEKFKLCKVNEGQYLMKQNSMASSFFILHEGKLVVEINGVAKRCIEPGEGFGELALLYSAPRSASIKAMKPSFLWFIDRQTFRNAVSSMITKNYKENRSFIENNQFFKYLTPNQKDKLASIALNQRFERNSDICKEGELAASMYILKSGKLGRFKGGDFQGHILKGESFQEYSSLTKGSVRRETVRVVEDAEVMALGVEDIENALGRSLPLIILRNEARSALKSSKFFEKLSEEYIERAIDCFKIKSVKQGELLVRKEDLCRNSIFFVAEGQYIISQNAKRAQIYGESALSDPTDSYKCEIRMKDNGKVAWATFNEVVKSFGCPYAEAVSNSASILKALQAQKNNRSNLNQITKNIKLQEFQVMKKLGEGQFGNVFLVSDAPKEHFYALKCISKYETIKTKLEKHLANEKCALNAITSPFVMEFIRSYKDQHYIYFLTEFINGMELFDAIRVIGLLNAEQTMFYGAQLLHIIETFHEKSFIYRDLKPENVMVCADGYLKLIDLGTCKKLNGTEKTFTMIGTPNYMAPETLAGKGYSFPVDLWSLGIVLYEFMAGFVPFGEDAEDPLQIYQQILKNPLKFPKHMKDNHVNSLIALLLNKTPDARLGGSFLNLKKHAAFDKISWMDLISKKTKPCFEVPKQKLVDLEKLKPKSRPLKFALKVPTKTTVNRKDLPANWDQIF